MIWRDIWHKYHSWYFKIVSNFTCLTAREITYNDFEISLEGFMPNITTNHGIIYTYFFIPQFKIYEIHNIQYFMYRFSCKKWTTLYFWNNFSQPATTWFVALRHSWVVKRATLLFTRFAAMSQKRHVFCCAFHRIFTPYKRAQGWCKVIITIIIIKLY